MGLRLRAPFPWFGGKSRVAPVVWEAFGNVRTYVEPFAGSLAVLLGRPDIGWHEVVNDRDALLTNFWRSVREEPDRVAHLCRDPMSETELRARHRVLLSRLRTGELARWLERHPHVYDAEIAAWWAWGLCQWIGGGWCQLASTGEPRQTRPAVTAAAGILLTGLEDSKAWLERLSDRLRSVSVLCGDWSRCVTTGVLGSPGSAGVVSGRRPCGVFLDPPYPHEVRDRELYREESASVAHDVVRWAIEHGDDPTMRIAVCGYAGSHEFPAGWESYAWAGARGYARSDSANRTLERVWFSPHCLTVGQQQSLFSRSASNG